jgi:[histone H3]-lysine36 N-dimethyltransferase SETMAR
MEKNEVRAVIKYLLKKNLSPTEIHADLQHTLGQSAPSYDIVKRWCREFKCGRESCEDAHGGGAPTTATTQENVNKVHDLIMKDRRLTVRDLAETTGLSVGTTHAILTTCLDMRKISARWVPRMLTIDQKRIRVTHSERLLAQYQQNPKGFLTRFVTMDETWVHHFDPESKRQSMEWKHHGSPPPRKFRVQPSAGKIMASIFWDAKGILLIDFLDRGATITGQYYADLIAKLREAIKSQRRGMLRRGVLFHQDNAPVHESRVAVAAIHEAGFELLDHPPYSPDLAPSDFHLFPNLKEHLRGTVFSSDDDVMNAVNQWLEDQEEEFFQTGIKALEHRWTKCISVGGDYVEK